MLRKLLPCLWVESYQPLSKAFILLLSLHSQIVESYNVYPPFLIKNGITLVYHSRSPCRHTEHPDLPSVIMTDNPPLLSYHPPTVEGNG